MANQGLTDEHETDIQTRDVQETNERAVREGRPFVLSVQLRERVCLCGSVLREVRQKRFLESVLDVFMRGDVRLRRLWVHSCHVLLVLGE